MTDYDEWRDDQRDYDHLMADDGPDDCEPGICPNCNGSGEGKHETEQCYQCNGTGEVCC